MRLKLLTGFDFFSSLVDFYSITQFDYLASFVKVLISLCVFVCSLEWFLVHFV